MHLLFILGDEILILLIFKILSSPSVFYSEEQQFVNNKRTMENKHNTNCSFSFKLKLGLNAIALVAKVIILWL